MITALALLATAAPAQPQPSAYPLAQVLDEARRACARGGLTASSPAAAAGWEPHTPAPDDLFGRYVAQTSRGGGGMKVVARTYSKTILGRTLLAFVTELRFSFAPDAPPGVTCEVFDPLAPVIGLAALKAWARRSPKRSMKLGADGVTAIWEPGFGRGVDETTIIWMAPGRGSGGARPGLSFSSIGHAESRRR